MKVLLFQQFSPIPQEMEYPGNPGVNDHLYVGNEICVITDVKKIEDAGPDDPQYKVYLYDRSKQNPKPDNPDFASESQDVSIVFLNKIGPLLGTMSPKDLLTAFYEDLVRSGSVVGKAADPITEPTQRTDH